MTRLVWQIRLDAEEDAAFRRLAAEAGTDRAGLFRLRVLGQTPSLAPVTAGSAATLEATLGRGLSTGEAAADEPVPVSPRASGSEKASVPGEGPAPSRAPKPTAAQLAGRTGLPLATCAVMLTDGRWEQFVK